MVGSAGIGFELMKIDDAENLRLQFAARLAGVLAFADGGVSLARGVEIATVRGNDGSRDIIAQIQGADRGACRPIRRWIM